MRYFLSFCTAIAFTLLNACMKDISCYRDMIIGTWIEQTFDGQEPESNLRSVHVFDRSNTRVVTHMTSDQQAIGSINLAYLITCKVIETMGAFSDGGVETMLYRHEEVLRFTDSTLRVRVVEEVLNGFVITPIAQEVTLKKVSKANENATTIQKLWEMSQSSDPTVPPFRIKFDKEGAYSLFLKSEKGPEEKEGDGDGEDNGDGGEGQEIWIVKSDENGKYGVYDSFLMTSFFNNPFWGVLGRNRVACWDLKITSTTTEEEKDGKKVEKVEYAMSWNAVVLLNGQRTEKSFTFIAIPEKP